jgi:hypothetical protein
MSNGAYPTDVRMTRRQFGQTACTIAGGLLAGRPLALFDGFHSASRTNPNPAPLLETLSARLPFYTRSVWTRVAPIYARLDKAGAFYRITIHHEGNKANYDRSIPDVTRDLRLDQAAHRSRGYGDIGYHFMIDYAGRLWEGRSLKYQGAHVSSRNPGNIGIVLLGNFEIQKPSDAQKKSLLKLVAELRRFYRISRLRIYGHRNLDATLCPGRNLYSFLPIVKSSTG